MFKLIRYKNNPILSPKHDSRWEAKAVFNPASTYKDGKFYLLYRAIGEHHNYISRLGLAVSDDGFNFKKVSNKTIITPSKSYDKWGVEDPRITKINDTYYITYVAIDKRLGGTPKPGASNVLTPKTALISTKNFKTFRHHGIITPKNTDNKDVVLFSEKINNKYVMIHRPYRWTKEWLENPLSKKIKVDFPCSVNKLPQKPAMWLAYSKDLKNWTNHKLLFESSKAEDQKNGAGPPPIKTDKGWILIYHKIKKTPTSYRYVNKVALLDLKNPQKVIAKIPHHILTPWRKYEKIGDVHNVVFPTGTVVKDGKLYIYYGAADKYCAVATVKIKSLLNELMRHTV